MPPPPPDLVVAVAQLDESSAGVDAVRRLAVSASSQGAHLLLLPECALHGYSIGTDAIRRAATPRDGPMLRECAEVAKANEIAICVGYAELDPVTRLIYNAAALLDASGALAHHYRCVCGDS